MIRKVAIIDDDKELLGHTAEILRASGYEVITISDAVLALDVIADQKPDVVLVDLVMPDKNGFELANDMNRILEGDNIPIIMMSSFFKKEFYSLMNLCGIKRWLNKPFQPLDLIAAISDVMAQRPGRWVAEAVFAEPN